jgi:hypothetical protein
MININCPWCNNTINEVGVVLLCNIKSPLDKSCIFCLCELNPLENAVDNKLVSCPKCGNLFHLNCFEEYLKHKSKSNEPPIINNTNVYNHFVFNPNLLTPIRSVSEVNNLYVGSRFINPRSSYILHPQNQIYYI